MEKIWSGYVALIRSGHLRGTGDDDADLGYWQDQLFLTFLIYCLPVSLVALIPGLVLSLQFGRFGIGAADVLAFSLLVLVTFTNRLSLAQKKICAVIIFYGISVFLIDTIGFMGPGVFYLFFITVLIALILPVRYAYWSVGLNAALLVVFAVGLKFGLFHSALNKQYSAGSWIAIGTNLIFGNIVIVTLVHKIFDKLQITIQNKSELQERYKSIFDKSPLPMWIFDTETLKFLEVNNAATKHYGFSQAEFLQMTIRDIRPDRAVAGVEKIVSSNKASGDFYEGNAQHIKKDGRYIYVRVESNLLYLDDRPVRLVLATDITAQVQQQLAVFNANQKIKESESDLRAVFDSTLDGFVLLDDEYRIKLFNARTVAHIKFNEHQQEYKLGQCIFDLIEPARIREFKQLIAKVYSGEVIDYDRKYTEPDGTITWLHYTLTPVYHDGVVKGACLSGRDITARKSYLQTIEEQNKKLREISWMQSHLVRAPLARILGLAPLLETARDNAEQRQIIEFIALSANELDDIIREISQRSGNVVNKYPMPVNGAT